MNYLKAEGYVVRLRGLPWSVGKEEVANFLSGCDVVDIHFTYNRDGRPSGEAYIELASDQDVSMALSKNQQHMGKRYIEVFKSNRSEMDFVVQKDGSGGQNVSSGDGVVRLRGLPFACTHDDIVNFFKGMQIVPNGIALLADDMGRASGEAYVQFASQSIADLALQKHKEKMGLRYVEIFKSSMMEAESAIAMQGKYIPGVGATGGAGGGRPTPYERSRGRGMRGSMRGRGAGNIKGVMAHYDDGYGTYGGYDDGEYDNGYGDGYGAGYGAYGSRGGRMTSRGAGMRGMMGGSRAMGRGRGARGRGGSMMKPTYESSTGHSVHMRGLPYAATESDIIQFFTPLNPVSVYIEYNDDGRPSGEADVDFATHAEAQQAMHKHKALMERRYIELFLHSDPSLSAGGYSSFEADPYGGDMYGF